MTSSYSQDCPPDSSPVLAAPVGTDRSVTASMACADAEQEGRDGYVLPTELLPDGQTGPRFDDDLWVLRPLLRRTIIAPTWTSPGSATR